MHSLAGEGLAESIEMHCRRRTAWMLGKDVDSRRRTRRGPNGWYGPLRL